MTATIYAQVMNPLKSVMADLRDQQMWEIDKAKTGMGADTKVLRQMAEKTAPHWLESAKSTYMSTSPMGQLYNYIMGGPTVVPQADGTTRTDADWTGFWHQFSGLMASDCQDRTYEIMKHVDRNEALVVTPAITRLEADYRKDLAALHERQSLMSQEEADRARKAIFARYSELVRNIDADECTKAAVAYQISYHRAHRSGARSVSFAWACCTIGLLHLTSEMDERTVPVAIRNVVGPVSETVRLENGMVVNPTTNEIIGCARISDGTYPAFAYDGRWFVSVKNNRPIQSVPVAATQSLQFKLVGFGYQGFSATAVIERLQIANGVCQIREASGEGVQGRTLGLFANEELLGVIDGADVFTTAALMGTQLQVNECDTPTYKSHGETRERKVLTIHACVTTSLIPGSEILARCNRTASYWSKSPKSHQTFGIERVRVQWMSGALPHKMTTKPGDVIARVFLNFGGTHDQIMTVRLSAEKVAANGRPELETDGPIPAGIAIREDASDAVANLLAFTSYKHAELRLRFHKATVVR